MPTEPLLLDIESAAETLGIGRSTLFGLIRAGEMPIVKIGKRTLIRRADLDAFIDGHTSTIPPSVHAERDRTIREAHAAGMTQAAIARAYGLTHQRVNQIVRAEG